MTETKPATTAPEHKPTAEQQEQITKDKAQRDKILAEHKEREKWMPTPTQAEIDQAALGGGAAVAKKPDGSPIETRQMAAQPGAPYVTKAA